MSSPRTERGFTIVELTLACAFIGVLLTTIALLTNHIISIYQKGLSLKAVNTVGEDLIDDITRDIAGSPIVPLSGNSLCYTYLSGGLQNSCISSGDNGFKLIFQKRTTSARIVKGNTNLPSVPSGGAFCTGHYSYLWNSGYVLDDTVYTRPNGSSLSGERAVLTLGSGDNRREIRDFHLLRVHDTSREVCKSAINNATSYITPGKDYTVSNVNAEVSELLGPSEDNLAFYDFNMFSPISSYHATTGHAFYSGTFILATVRGGVNIMASGNYCTETPDFLNTDFAYCAMNKFNFATRATGEGIR